MELGVGDQKGLLSAIGLFPFSSLASWQKPEMTPARVYSLH
jgi:hypothetical protein